MAPKSLPPAAKQALIVKWFHESLSAYSIKDLEKSLPTIASINGMQVKDYIQALTDENQIRVEKIGSGNWYWSFPSDAKKIKQRTLNDLTTEQEKLTISLTDVERQVEEETLARADGSGEVDRAVLLEQHRSLLEETQKLEEELASYSENDPATLLQRRKEAVKLKESAERWTDNLEAIEYFLVNLTQDRSKVASIMENTCGSEYISGEGLREL